MVVGIRAKNAPFSNPEIASILMQKYATLREEELLHITNTKSHVQHIQAFVGISVGIVAFATFAFSSSSTSLAILNLIQDKWEIWVISLFFLTVVTNYLFLDVFESYLSLHAISARLREIESEINKLSGRHLLMWESIGARETLNRAIFHISVCGIKISIPNPGHAKGLFAYLIMLTGAAIAPCYFYYELWTSNPEYKTYLEFLAGITITLCAFSSVIGFLHLAFSRERTINILSRISKTK